MSEISPRKLNLNLSDSHASERKMSPLSPEMRRRINSNDKNELIRSSSNNQQEFSQSFEDVREEKLLIPRHMIDIEYENSKGDVITEKQYKNKCFESLSDADEEWTLSKQTLIELLKLVYDQIDE